MQDQSYENWKVEFCRKVQDKAPTNGPTNSASYYDAAFLILSTFEVDNPKSYKDASTKQAYVNEVTRLSDQIIKKDLSLSDSEEARDELRKLPEFQRLNQLYGDKSIQWKPIFWAVAPPVGVGLTYAGAAIRDAAAGVHEHVEAVNSFFAETAPIIATFSVAYYAALIFFEYCLKKEDLLANQESAASSSQLAQK
jgi:hypothetical protein